MFKTTKYFKYCYENDTTVEYVATGLYTMLNCSFTSEDEDYGTDTIHFRMKGDVSMERISFEMLREIKDFLDYREGSIEASRADVQNDYDQYSNSTLIAFEYALSDITKDYNPGKWYATISDAGRMISKALLEDRTKVFSFCESNREEANGDPAKHEDNGNWYGVRRIPGFFDNDPGEFIVAVGYYGGGKVAFAYADWDEADDSTCESALVGAICKATGLCMDDMIYIEEEEEEK